jgi:uroporphyrinogen III methyltransferase / synthase
VLIARALEARDALPEALRSHGAEVDVVAAYQTLPAEPQGSELAALLEAGGADVMLFTSSSTVTSTFELLGDRAKSLLERVVVASIGPVTSDTLRGLGLEPTVSAERYTVDGLLDALEHHFSRR